MQICKHVYKLPHSEQTSQPAPPPSSNKQAHCSIRCQPLAQIQATGDAPLSLGAENYPHSSTAAPPSPSLSEPSSLSLYFCLSASWICRSCRRCLLLFFCSLAPRCLDCGFEGSTAEINGYVMVAVTVIRYHFLMEQCTSFLVLNTDQLSRATQRTGQVTNILIFLPLLLVLYHVAAVVGHDILPETSSGAFKIQLLRRIFTEIHDS